MRIFVTLVLLFVCTLSFANDKSIIKPIHTVVSIPLRASEFVKLSAKEYGNLVGKKMKFKGRIEFAMLKMKMRHDLKKNPDLFVTDYLTPLKSDKFRLNGLWFALGLFLGPFAVIAAYVTKQEKNKITSTWIGFGVYIVVITIVVLAAIAAISSATKSCNWPM